MHRIVARKAVIAVGTFVFTSVFSVFVLADDIKPSTQSDAKQVDTPAIRSTRFEDWFYRCVDLKSSDGASIASCEVVQIAQIKQGAENVNVLTLAIAKTAPVVGKKSSNNDLLLTALVPLNVVLPVGLGLRVNERDVVTIPYRNCNQTGCWAQQKLDGKMLAALQKGTAGEAKLRLMNGQNINLKFSLKGLSKALTELQKPSKA